ncbi:hypothetical protein U9M48_044165, partial [Paspalum notatum var. saurae]
AQPKRPRAGAARDPTAGDRRGVEDPAGWESPHPRGPAPGTFLPVPHSHLSPPASSLVGSSPSAHFPSPVPTPRRKPNPPPHGHPVRAVPCPTVERHPKPQTHGTARPASTASQHQHGRARPRGIVEARVLLLPPRTHAPVGGLFSPPLRAAGVLRRQRGNHASHGVRDGGRPWRRRVARLRGARGARGRVAGLGLAARGRWRRALVAVASLQDHHLEPPPSRARAVAPQADEHEEEGVHVNVNGAAAAAAETSSPHLVPGKTVRVRFVLKKQCAFGQSVYLVGDAPALGLWDPSNASALKWAESHEWILEKDLPANELIEFKFLLRDSAGKLHWQNGPNRSFQTGETANTLVVFEDWDDVKNQKIEEQEGVEDIGIEQAVVSDDSESRKGGTALEDELHMDNNQEVKEDESIVVAEEDKQSAVPTDASVQVDLVKTNDANPQKSMLHKEQEILDELCGKEDLENSSISCADESYAEKTGDNILSEDGVPVENGLTTAYEHDLLWGWKALQQLLMNLGSKMDTT